MVVVVVVEAAGHGHGNPAPNSDPNPNPGPNPNPNPTQDVMTCIKAAGKEKDFPLMCQIHAIAFEGAKCETIIEINK